MIKNKRGSLALIIIILAIIIIGGIIAYFVIRGSSSKRILPADICVYDNEKYITCGTAFVLVSEGIEYALVANEAFYFPGGENKLIALVDLSKPEDEGAF